MTFEPLTTGAIEDVRAAMPADHPASMFVAQIEAQDVGAAEASSAAGLRAADTAGEG